MNSHADLPATIERYFALIDSDTPEKAVDCFSDDVLVRDDGHAYSGRGEVLSWLTGPVSEYDTTSTRLSTTTAGDTVTVTTRLTGNFPGGQVDLTNTFVLDADGRIRQLTIAA